jgi:hypothetical protein
VAGTASTREGRQASRAGERALSVAMEGAPSGSVAPPSITLPKGGGA